MGGSRGLVYRYRGGWFLEDLGCEEGGNGVRVVRKCPVY